MSLPKGYTELEYIESTGTQYVDTLFTPNQDTRVVCDFELTSVPSTHAALFASRNGLANAFALFHDKGLGTIYDQYASEYATPSGFSIIGRHTVDKNKNVTTIDGTTAKTFTYTTFTGTCSMYLLVDRSPSSNGGLPFSGKLYSCQIYDNGLLIRDYVPAKTIEGEIGLYDRVFKEFYRNAGSGTFTAGPEVVIALDPPASVEQVLSVKLAWSAVDNASFYRIYRDGVQIGETEDLTYADDTAEFGQTYRYGITACSGSSESAPTELTVYTREGYAVIRPVVTSANFL